MIKQKINYSSLRDYFTFGELIAEDLITCLVSNTETIHQMEIEFEENMSLRRIEEIEELSISLNLQDIFNSYMPKLYYKDNRYRLEGNYNLFLTKVLRRINTLDKNE